MAQEINLVPDIKNEMIKTIKLRNRIFFICTLVISFSIGIIIILSLVVSGQQMALESKKTTLENLSSKINSYSDFNDFLTIKNQLDNISTLTDNKKVLSRTFNILSALLPNNSDTITISELNINLSEENPTFSFDAQANSGTEPFIDYNVLDSFKKSMQYMRYDYGRYVDKNGANIPAYCIIESGEDGATFSDADRGIYAFWTIDSEGCNPSSDINKNNYSLEYYNDIEVVRIWRTPQFNDWYKETEIPGKPYMSLDGDISGVEHFESACISYSGTIEQGSSKPKWTNLNESCLLVPDGVDGIKVSESSNGRSTGDELVLRFSASISLAPGIYDFNNFHMLAIAPSGRYNVTDSYIQIQAMFSERAKDCAEGDTACNDNGGQ